MKTYIIETRKGEFYCGKTGDIKKRIKQHLQEKKPHWFAFNDRKNILKIFTIKGDLEKKIKKFGIKNLNYFMGNYSFVKLDGLVPLPP